MKKIFSIFALSLLLLGMNACNSDNEDDMTRQIQGDMLSNVVSIAEGTSVNLSSSTATMIWNVLSSKVSINYSVVVTNSITANVSIKDADLQVDDTYGCYTFSAADGGSGITNLHGYYRPETGCLYIDFIVNGTYRVMSAAQLYYPYMNINVTNTETSAVKTNENGAMLISINPSTLSAYLIMGNMSLEEAGYTINQMTFSNLDVEATSTGYKVTSNEDKHSSDGTYILNNFEAIISGNGQVVSGTFTINTKYNGSFSGKAFAN